VQVDGINIHYVLAGPAQAPPVVLVHGLGGTFTTWSLNVPAFAKNLRVCALDMIGSGNSDKPVQMDYSVEAQSRFLARVLDTLGPNWQRVNLVGHSLGGAVAQAFAQQQPGSVEKLVLVDSVGLGPEIDETWLHLIHHDPNHTKIREELLRFFVDSHLVQQALVDMLYQQRTQPGAYEALIATADAAFNDGRQRIDLRNALAAFPGPVLVIWGAKDQIIPVAHAQEVKQAQHGSLLILADCGHCPYIERSDLFNQTVSTFLVAS
jgi:pyruvate dehydrogenase E2 component (dihydrolipoamide acetyltransferase)